MKQKKPKTQVKKKDTTINKVQNNEYIKQFQKSDILVLIAVLIFTINTYLAYLSYPLPFSFINNWISDLGCTLINPGAPFFNISCIVVGAIFAILFTRSKKALIMIAGILMSFSLILVGWFPSELFIFHSFAGGLFFLTMIFCIFLTILSTGGGMRIYGIIAICINLIFLIFAYNPLWEWLTFATNFSFICITAYHY